MGLAKSVPKMCKNVATHSLKNLQYANMSLPKKFDGIMFPFRNWIPFWIKVDLDLSTFNTKQNNIYSIVQSGLRSTCHFQHRYRSTMYHRYQSTRFNRRSYSTKSRRSYSVVDPVAMHHPRSYLCYATYEQFSKVHSILDPFQLQHFLMAYLLESIIDFFFILEHF